jgi:5'-nucleotidase / UDP-sugar diphosphatase
MDRRHVRRILGTVVLVLTAACSSNDKPTPRASTSAPAEAGVVTMTLLQVNDVYELTPVSGGTEGGMARLATLRKQLLAENPNTFTILSGDLVSPSALGTATVDGQRLAGKQMVDVMNVLGLNYATFGNHEFDLAQEELAQRVQESKFTWFSSNVDDVNGQPMFGLPRNVVFTVKSAGGKEARVGLFGVTTAANRTSYVGYRDPLDVATQQVAELRAKVDVLIAVTHLSMEDDIRLAQALPDIDLVLGGHEHENAEVQRGRDFTPITKADANARTAQVHEVRFDPASRRLTIDSRLRRVTAELPDDPEVAKAVDRWVQAAFAGFRSQGFDPQRVVARTNESLDGREASVRNHPTRLTDAIARSQLGAASGTEVSIFNSGSIRIDDELPPGDITEYDVIRTLPFGGTVVSARVKGSVLQQVLDRGSASVGTGGYLQAANVSRGGDQWLIGGAPLDPGSVYAVAVNDYLLSGRATGLEYFSRDNPDVTGVAEHGDVRKALIAELQG